MMEQILCPYGYQSEDVEKLSMMYYIFGIVGGFIITKIIEKYNIRYSRAYIFFSLMILLSFVCFDFCITTETNESDKDPDNNPVVEAQHRFL